MENVTDYKTAIMQAARVAGNLKKEAERVLADCEHTVKIIGDGKKGAKLIHVAALTDWLQAYIELQAGSEAKAAGVIKATLNTASKSWETGTIGIQKVSGAYFLSLTPPKEETVDPFADMVATLREVNKGLDGQKQAEMLAMLDIVRGKFA